MANYKITKDSVKLEDGYTRFMVSINDGAEELFEVKGTDKEVIYTALDAAAEGLEAQQAVVDEVPVLSENKKLTSGAELTKLKASAKEVA